MPFYKYYCKSCQNVMMICHSMNDKATICLECEAQNSLERIFTDSFDVVSNNKKEVVKVVDSYIKEAKEILEEHKEELKNKEYKK